MAVEVVYFKTERGDEPVREFVDGLAIGSKRKFWRKVAYLEQFGKDLCEPHAKYLGQGVYELRFRGPDGHFRILYFFFSGHCVVLTNAFKKQTDRTPKREMELALARMTQFRGNQ